MNGRYMREMGTRELTRAPGGAHRPRRICTTRSRSREEKIQTLADFWPLAGFVFDGPADDPTAREKWLADDGREALADGPRALAGVEPFDRRRTRAGAARVVEARGRQARQDVYQPVRVALSGTTVSPGIFETLAVLGRDESLARIDAALRT